MKLTIYFDMDGTIFDLYGVNNWLEDIKAEKERPYLKAKPMVDFEELAEVLRKLQEKQVEIAVISWLAKYSTQEYKKKVRRAKRQMLKTIPIQFDKIHLVQYGTPKERVAQNKEYRILFDDDDLVLKQWERGKGRKVAIDVKEKDILEELEKILEGVS